MKKKPSGFKVLIRLTGFGNNAVSPFGMLERVPIIVTESISRLDPPVLFLGAGDVDWKVCTPLRVLINELDASIIDLSE